MQYGPDVPTSESQRIGGGSNYFFGGSSALATAAQTVDVSGQATDIDAGKRTAQLQSQMAGFSSQGDNGTVKDDLFTKFSAYAKANEIPAMKLEAFFTDLKSEIVKRGYPYETHRVGPEKNRGPRLLKGVVYVEQKAEDDTETKDGEQKSPPPKAKMSEIIETKKGGGS